MFDWVAQQFVVSLYVAMNNNGKRRPGCKGVESMQVLKTPD